MSCCFLVSGCLDVCYCCCCFQWCVAENMQLHWVPENCVTYNLYNLTASIVSASCNQLLMAFLPSSLIVLCHSRPGFQNSCSRTLALWGKKIWFSKEHKTWHKRQNLRYILVFLPRFFMLFSLWVLFCLRSSSSAFQVLSDENFYWRALRLVCTDCLASADKIYGCCSNILSDCHFFQSILDILGCDQFIHISTPCLVSRTFGWCSMSSLAACCGTKFAQAGESLTPKLCHWYSYNSKVGSWVVSTWIEGILIPVVLL